MAMDIWTDLDSALQRLDVVGAKLACARPTNGAVCTISPPLGADPSSLTITSQPCSSYGRHQPDGRGCDRRSPDGSDEDKQLLLLSFSSQSSLGYHSGSALSEDVQLSSSRGKSSSPCLLSGPQMSPDHQEKRFLKNGPSLQRAACSSEIAAYESHAQHAGQRTAYFNHCNKESQVSKQKTSAGELNVRALKEETGASAGPVSLAHEHAIKSCLKFNDGISGSDKGIETAVKLYNGKPAMHTPGSHLMPLASAPALMTPAAKKPVRPSGIPKALVATTVSEGDFHKAFESIPTIHVQSSADLDAMLQQAEKLLSDAGQDWEQRVTALKTLRGVVLAAGRSLLCRDAGRLRSLAICFQLCLGDPRSQVVRETCISIGFFSQTLGIVVEHFSEIVFHPLVNLTMNSVAVMATAGSVALRFMIQHVHSTRLMPLIAQQLTSRSSQVRRQACELIEQTLSLWESNILEKHLTTLQETIFKGLSDADSEVRAASRRAFWRLYARFQKQANSVLDSLDAAKQSQLWQDKPLDDRTNRVPAPTAASAIVRLTSAGRSSSRGADGTTKSASSSPSTGTAPCVGTVSNTGTVRSKLKPTSAGQLLNTKISCTGSPAGSTFSCTPPRSACSGDGSSCTPPLSNLSRLHEAAAVSREHLVKATNTVGRDQQKPTGPHGSSVHLADNVQSPGDAGNASKRHSNLSHQMEPSHSSRSSRLSHSPCIQPFVSRRHTGDGQANPYCQVAIGEGCDVEEDGEASDVSSVCSETLGGPVAAHPATEDVGEVLANMSSSRWPERKKGLQQLQRFVVDTRSLRPQELKKVTEVFTRMFYDPNLKVYSLFLDALVDVVRVHPHDLRDWLPTLLARLLLAKREGDRLASVYSKIRTLLTTVRTSFDNVDQLRAVADILVDDAHTPTVKERQRVLRYLLDLLGQMDSSEFVVDGSMEKHFLLLLNRLVVWMNEPKSYDNRKTSQEILAALLGLNAPTFSSLLGRLPGHVQDGARRALQTHMRGLYAAADTATAAEAPSTNNSLSAMQDSESGQIARHRHMEVREMAAGGRSGQRATTEAEHRPLASAGSDCNWICDSGSFASRTRHLGGQMSRDSGVHGSLPDVGCLSPASSSDLKDPGESSSSAAVHKQNNECRGEQCSPDNEEQYPRKPISNATMLENCKGHPNPSYAAGHCSILPDVITQLSPETTLRNLSLIHANKDRISQLCHRKDLNMGVPSCDDGGHFLDALAQSDVGQRVIALNSLRQLVLQNEVGILEQHLDDMLWKVFKAHDTSSQESVTAADSCLEAIASAVDPERLVSVVCEASQSKDASVRIAAIKIEAMIIRMLSKAAIDCHVSALLPGLVQGFNHEDSTMRKASVMALVELHARVGDALVERHLVSTLNSSKLKLFSLYVERAAEARSKVIIGKESNELCR